ncbi:hypothetical protein NNJEOMEG_00167 [Fundidesulfovibrio magnetotacticus]|uniref:Uncharacterized protein n=1 Tax=Fundidesulfovibrio magnetotacticus TaxID=2730080 RepID=A0A6V8LHZ7_9BACT|nr:hypothetical protein [Fundidesulfovibrio magnetotacticus]GFK92343.1 hypothetical protein NNJEOMEG_00167 [Fundidesulfovibrio magnetotacticus]
MSTNLKNRVGKIVERMGDLSDPVEAFKAKARAMTHEELRAALRDAMLANGYDPSLPHDEALAAHIARLEAEAETKTPEEQEVARQLVDVVRRQADSIARLFPESPRSDAVGNDAA